MSSDQNNSNVTPYDADPEMTPIARGIIKEKFKELTSVHPHTREHIVRSDRVRHFALAAYGNDKDKATRLSVKLDTLLREEARLRPKRELGPFFNSGRS